MSTTSCFAPRLPDDTLAIARVCMAAKLPYVVNNAYGVQSPAIMKRLEAAITHARVDAFIQSSDKNFLVPVGGSVIAGAHDVVKEVCELYAGRANASPIVDLFITFLQMGREGFRRLLRERLELHTRFVSRVAEFAARRNEELVLHPKNDISFGFTLRNVSQPTAIGAELFRHCVTGPRVIDPAKTQTVCGTPFRGYGTHSAESRVPMLIMACGIGMLAADIDEFIARLEDAYPLPPPPAPPAVASAT